MAEDMKPDHHNVVDFKQRQETRQHVLERLYREHSTALRSFLHGRMGGSHELEDVLQEVFVRLARMEDLNERLPPGRKDCRSFIYTTANHLIVDMERRRAVRRGHLEAEQESALEVRVEVATDALADDTRQLDVIERAIKSLPPVWRQAFVLSRFRHMSYKQIADKMGVSARSVEKYIGHALVKIRAAISRAQGEE